MNPRITSIENLIATDPGGRNIFGLALADQLRLAAQSLRLADCVAVVSGFYIPEAGAGETDGPPGAKILGDTLAQMGIAVDYVTDTRNALLFRSLGLNPTVDMDDYLDRARPSHLVAIERAGRGPDGRYRNMHGLDITDTTAPLDELFLEAARRGLTTIGIGDGGNEIGMGKVFAQVGSERDDADRPKTMTTAPQERKAPTDQQPSRPAAGERRAFTRGIKGDGADERSDIRFVPPLPPARCSVPTDFCIVAGVSNWGAIGLSGALSVLVGRDLLPSADTVARDLERIVRDGGAVDGVTHRSELSTDGQDLASTLRILEQVRRQIAPSPLLRKEPLLAGVLGYGESGRAAAALLAHHGHRVCISDEAAVTLERGMTVAGVETGGHSIDFLGACDLVVASPGVPADRPILDALHARGIYVMSELELAYQLRTLPDRRGTAGPPRGPVPEPSPSQNHDHEGAAPMQASREREDTDSEPLRPAEPSCDREGAVPTAVLSSEPTLIAVTGTVGKRTTVELLQRLFQAAGHNLTIGGNRGLPLSAVLLDRITPKPRASACANDRMTTKPRALHSDAADPIALAVSSFQLETVVHFRPDVAVILNINEAHLDRHRSLAEYVRIKSRIFMNQGAHDALILPFDDERVRILARKHAGRTFFVSANQAVDRGAWWIDGRVRMNVGGEIEDIGHVADASRAADPRVACPRLPGHILSFPENLLAAVLSARLCGLSADSIAAALRQLAAADATPEPRTSTRAGGAQ